jgi:predicted homoserine dehydrogenase-like protein
MDLVAIANRHPEAARSAFRDAGVDDFVGVASQEAMEEALAAGRRAVTSDASMLCDAAGIDAIVEVTGTVEHAARVARAAIRNRKHLVLMNAEVDSTVGAILKTHAHDASVVYTGSDGDQPGVIMNLYRFVKGIGARPVLCGSIKGLHDTKRNPTTQRAFARKWGQNVHMVTSFADGTKISFEQSIVANATCMRVARRGMLGPTVDAGTRIEDAAQWYPQEELLQGPGLVDYVVGASPGPGVFVLGAHDHPAQQHYLSLYKLGDGPLYCFYTPYHLCHFETPATVARAVEFGDAAIAPAGAPHVDVVTTAKVDLRAGDVLDGIGGYTTYGQCENSDETYAEGLLPMGLAEGARMVNDVAADRVLTYEDVKLPPGRLSDELRREQDVRFFGEPRGPS